ncbi:hypothetical protein QQX98_012614 [Neonectria punicea]|uniref:Cysteine-rich transmembrane CYSTM domain-containing protein n=1 Tax=Neonectria punicea TaxID=979145 RepID=A0ABR1GIM6_9HYPO
MSNQDYYNSQGGGYPQHPQASYGPPQGQYGPPQGQYGPPQGQGQYYPPPGQQPPMQYQQAPPPQQQKQGGGGGNCLTACLAALCCCCFRMLRMSLLSQPTSVENPDCHDADARRPMPELDHD